MKKLMGILPDIMAVCGVCCIVAALWLLSPVAGLLGMGAVLLGGAVLLAMGRGDDG